MTTIAHEWVDDQSAFERILTEVSGVDRYAIDTEFHRERTYFPALALVQIAWGDRIVLVDPLAVDVTAMADLFHSEVEAVFHAAQQDLDVLTYAVGAVPDHFFDTQLAGGFLGYGTPSLVSLLSAELGVSPAKGDRLTDWLRRPLTEAQRSYAASDVAHLLEVRDRLVERLKQRGREAWVAEACAELAARNAVRSEPEQAWLRLKDVRSLKPRGRAVAQEVAAWRERRAMALDVPVRQVLPDLAVLGVSQRQPRDERELAQARGVDGRHTKGVVATELLAAVARGLENEPPQPPTGGDELGRDLRPAVALVSAWVSQMARDEAIDTALLATRADLVSLLSGDPASRLASGWRAELLGDGIRSLVEGRAGLTFNGSGGLRLVSVDAVG
ncbi:MAG: HRDC domain-containing protein [Ilumatobacter sp.]